MFWKELFDLRNKILQEREDQKNKSDISDFITFLRETILKNKDEVENAFRNYVINNPIRNTYSIERVYSVPINYANGIILFFGTLGRTYYNDFISDNFKEEFKYINISIKNATNKDEYKVLVRFHIDFTEKHVF